MDEPLAISPPDPWLPEAEPSSSHSGAVDNNKTALPADSVPDLTSQASRSESAGIPTTANQPLLLGRLQVAPGDTIVQLVRRVRGNFDPKYMDSLLALNPHIKDPDSIAINDEIIFPATPVTVSPLIDQTHWLQLSESASLDEAYQAFNAYRRQGLSVHLVPYWTVVTGLRFVVLMGEAFASPEAVRQRMETLTADLDAQSRVRSQWGRDPVFFASPF
jgi:hypothetical protein